MKVGENDYFNLTYCTNIHGGESWKDVFTNLQFFLPPLKRTYAQDKVFGIGLRLSNRAADDLLLGNNLFEFKKWLEDNQYYLITVNAFPYGNFHNSIVKENVYSPDWTTEARRDYSLKIAKIISALTPRGGECGFSTSPLTYKFWLDADNHNAAIQHATRHLCDVVDYLAKIYDDLSSLIHIDIEPEPDCFIETSEELVKYFEQWLIPFGSQYLVNQYQYSYRQAEESIRRHVQVCFDVCHASVEFESPANFFRSMQNAGISLGKVQISSALRGRPNEQFQELEQIKSFLRQFIDPVYLHQVVLRNSNGLYRHRDLTHYFIDGLTSDIEEFRTHFHVPIFLQNYGKLSTTQQDILQTLKMLKTYKTSSVLEIETYTWDVLPGELKTDMLSSIKKEYEWVIDNF